MKGLGYTSNDEKYGDVGLSRAIVEIDAADNDHAEGDDHGDGAGDGAAYCAEQEEDHLHHKVYHVPAGLVRVTDATEQGVIRGGLGCKQSEIVRVFYVLFPTIGIHSLFIGWGRTS